MKIISGSSNPTLAKNIALQLNTPLIPCEIDKFANGEKRITVGEEAKGSDILLVQSFSNPVDEHIIETMLIADALERLGTKSVSLFIPWFGYSFQDKVFMPGQPLSAKVIARILESNSIGRIYLLDLHNVSIPGFFTSPTQHLTAVETFITHIKRSFDLKNTIVASPDFGGLKRARKFADKLNLEMVSVEKRRDLKTGNVTTAKLEGNVKNKIILIFDDAILSGQTTVEVAKLLKGKGAKEVHFFATHGVFTGNALEDLGKSQIDTVVVTNSIEHPENFKKITVLDVAKTFISNL